MYKQRALRTLAQALQYGRPITRRYVSTRQWSTPLAKTIAEAIETTGPISIAAYMRQCLTNPSHGYYTTKTLEDKDQFGVRGDFITSPEISQIFGELCGLWFVAEWMAQGRKKTGVELVELGPGRGTLMDDLLRTIKNFKGLAESIEAVYLIEASPSLREKQKTLLCGDAAVMTEIDIGYRSTSKYTDIPVVWCEDIRFVPNDASKTPFFMAHEFFDALPIHAFQSVAPAPDQPKTIQGLNGPIELPYDKLSQLPQSRASKTPQWRELMVTPSPSSSVITTSRPGLFSDSKPEFQLSTAKASTPSSLVLPETSSRYKSLKNTPASTIEISPESQSYASELSRRIGGSPESPKRVPSGAALIIDYGTTSTVPTSTLRGIRAHELVSPFSQPGLVDLSADVDFLALVEASINASEGVEAHGPVEQADWLLELGIRERVEMLSKKMASTADDGEDGAEDVRKAAARLTDRGVSGMGRLYKVLAIVPENGGRRAPVGFGGRLA